MKAIISITDFLLQLFVITRPGGSQSEADLECRKNDENKLYVDDEAVRKHHIQQCRTSDKE